MADFSKTISNRIGIFGGGEGSRFSGLKLGTAHWGTNHMLVTLITSGILSQTVSNTLTLSSAIRKTLTKGISDSINLTTAVIKIPTKGITDGIALTTTIQASIVTPGVLTKTISNSLSFAGTPYKGVSKGIADAITIATAPHFNVAKGISDNFTLTSDARLEIAKYIANTIAFTTTVNSTYEKIAFIQNTIAFTTLIGDFNITKTISNNLHLTLEIGRIRDSILFYNSFGLSSKISRVYRIENGWINELLKRPEIWIEDTPATTVWS